MTARRKQIWTVLLVTPLIVGSLLYIGAGREDKCLSTPSQLTKLHSDNPYLFACDGHIYLPSSRAKSRYRRLDNDEIDPATLTVLPFKYAHDGKQLYYVTVINTDFDDNEYDLKPIPGVDLASLEILRDAFVRDKNNNWTVLSNHFLVEPRSDR